ncbi:MAG TPA: ADP-ribosyl-[dinitrogen reductase] hydrolase [Burkholderiales bacterium]
MVADPEGAIRDRALGAYLGFAAGDALGATVEFMTAREIAAHHGVHRDITGGGWLRLAPGQVTDDTQMALALGSAILASGGWNLRAAADAFAAWLRTRPPDVGNTCRRGIQRYVATGEPQTPVNEGDAGNGALMRNLPVCLAFLRDDAGFERATLEQARITHNHPLSDAACLALGRMTRRLVLGEGRDACREEAEALVRAQPKFRFDPYPGRASGYVVDTVQTVLHHFFSCESLEECVVETVNRGDDADTTGALAGMLAGALHGAQAVPGRWRRRLDPGVVEEIRRQGDGLLALPGNT